MGSAELTEQCVQPGTWTIHRAATSQLCTACKSILESLLLEEKTAKQSVPRLREHTSPVCVGT